MNANIAIGLALLVCIVGGAVWYMAADQRKKILGIVAFGAGLLVTLLELHGGIVMSLSR